MKRNRGLVGTVVLLAIVALLVLRPWQAGLGDEGGPSTITARILRAVDGDTLEVAARGPARGRAADRGRHAGDGQAGDPGAVLRAARLRLHPPRRRRPPGAPRGSASSAATSTAGCSPTSSSASRGLSTRGAPSTPSSSQGPRTHADDPAQRPLRAALRAPRADGRAGRARPLGRLPALSSRVTLATFQWPASGPAACYGPPRPPGGRSHANETEHLPVRVGLRAGDLP